LKAEVKQLKEANTILRKRHRARKTRLRQGDSMNITEGQALQDQNDVEEQAKTEVVGQGMRQRVGDVVCAASPVIIHELVRLM
jgi:hypothetical protein